MIALHLQSHNQQFFREPCGICGRKFGSYYIKWSSPDTM